MIKLTELEKIEIKLEIEKIESRIEKDKENYLIAFGSLSDYECFLNCDIFKSILKYADSHYRFCDNQFEIMLIDLKNCVVVSFNESFYAYEI